MSLDPLCLVASKGFEFGGQVAACIADDDAGQVSRPGRAPTDLDGQQRQGDREQALAEEARSGSDRIGAQRAGPGGAGSRVAGWMADAQYWYSEDKYCCGGQLYTAKTWLWRHGNGVVEKTGPKNNTDSVCRSDLFTAPFIDSYKFGPYTWSQLYTLPTDPAALKAKLMADFGQGGGPTLFEDVPRPALAQQPGGSA